MISQISEFETINEEFRSQKSCAPWLPEKKTILAELKQQGSELSRIREEIMFTSGLISERENLLAKHKIIPFNMFCITMGNYLHKTMQMDITMKNELKIQELVLISKKI